MKHYETPIDFEINESFEGNNISYVNLREICQGGPQVGRIILNDKIITGHEFGGPFLYHEKHIYIPILTSHFIFSFLSFKLAKINVMTREIQFVGENKALIFLNKIEDNKVYYYGDINKEKLSCFYI